MTDLRVAHLWESYKPGQFGDPHELLPERGVQSRLISYDIYRNGAPVPPGTAPLFDADPDQATTAGRVGLLVAGLRRRARWSKFLAHVDAQLTAEPPDVIHAHFATTAASMLPVLRKHPQPLVVTLYGWDASAALERKRWQEEYPRLFERADLLLVLCDEVVDRLVALGCPKEKLRVWNLPAGVEAYDFRARAAHEPVRLLIGARFAPKKGYFVLLEAISRLRDAGRDIRLTAVGYGSLRGEVEAEVERRGLGDVVDIVDTRASGSFHPFFNRVVAEHDVFALPSLRTRDGDDEGGPALVLVCAQAGGMPCVTTPFPGSERSVTDGVTGILSEEGSVDSLVERLTWTLDHPERWADIGTAASELVRKEFSLDGQLDGLLEHYRRVVGP